MILALTLDCGFNMNISVTPSCRTGIRDKVCKLGRRWCVVCLWKGSWKQLFLLSQWRYTKRQNMAIHLICIP